MKKIFLIVLFLVSTFSSFNVNAKEIVLNFAYRSSVYVGIESEKTIKISIPTAKEAREIAEAKNQEVIFEEIKAVINKATNSLSVAFVDIKTGKLISSVLYQLTSDTQNNFAGGHGFTGLVYVSSPKEAELQFWGTIE